MRHPPPVIALCRVLLPLLAVLAGAGCREEVPPVEADALQTSRDAYERLLEATPDSVFAVLSPVDSLFLGYDSLLFRRGGIDSVRAAQWVDSTLGALSLDDKIGQLFIVHLPRRGLGQLLQDEALEAATRYGVGGFLVSRLMPPRDVFEATQRLQRASRVPLFFAADYERGAGRFNNPFTELPSNMALGAARDTVLAAAAGRLSAIESGAMGVNLLFAPVVDVNNNPANPIINIRSYGERADLVGRMAASFVREAEAYGVLTTLKHFPGHGDTEVDSHARMGAISGSRAALDSVELRPYEMLLRQGHPPAGVMTAHLWIQALDEEPLPATFSRRVLHDLLRDTLGFEGFVVTDDVKMGALQNRYGADERTVRPLLAGADLILTPDDLGAAVEAVREALAQGRLTEADLDRSVRRLLAAKARAGLHANRFADARALDYLLEAPRGAFLAQAIADRAVTLLKTSPVLPLDTTRHLTLVQLTNDRNSPSIEAAMDYFAERMGKGTPVEEVRFDGDPSAEAAAETLEKAAADVVVLALYLRLQSGRGEAGLYGRQEALAQALLAQGRPVVLVTFGNPYAVTTFAEADVHLVAYDQTLESVQAAAGILRGMQAPRGLLPITVTPYAYASGLRQLDPGQPVRSTSSSAR
jgi:beta-N-acetylhexosaminidase